MVSLLFRHFQWSQTDTAEAEKSLLSYIFQTDEAKQAYEVFDVDLPDGSHISTLRLQAPATRETSAEENAKTPPVLLLHGFGAGKATWAPILQRLTSCPARSTVYAIDLPGMGCSSPFLPNQKQDLTSLFDDGGRIIRKTDRQHVNKLSLRTVQYYIAAIYAWMKELRLDQLVIIGHSLGAYIAASFAHAYPQYVHKLILLSPVGLDSERELIGIPILDGSHTAIPDSSGKTSLIERVIEYVWKKYHRTPIALIRLGGPLLPWAIRSFVSSSNLFDWIADDKKLRKLVWHYTYGLIRRPSSAEVLMPYFITGRGSAVCQEGANLVELLDKGVQVICIRGSCDWVPALANASELEQLGLRMVTLDKGEHSMHLIEPDRVWPLIDAELSSAPSLA